MKTKQKSKKPETTLPIAVIGGGPAGMIAAQTAVKKYKNVILYDKNPIPGKKLGSVRYRPIYVSEKLSPEETAKAFGEKKDFILPALKSYGWEKISEQLRKIGFTLGLNGDRRLLIPSDESPEFSVRLRDAAETAGVTIKKSSKVSDIVISRGKVKGVVVNGVTHPVSAVIVASGSFSSPKLGSTRDGYVMAEKAGHKVVPIQPAMVGFETVEKFGKILSTILIKDCQMDIYQNDELRISDRGDIFFTKHGVEGDLMFNHTAELNDLLKKTPLKVHLDLTPDLTKHDIERIMGQELESKDRSTVWEILTRYVPDRMLDVMHRMIRVHCRKPAVTLSNLERKLIAVWLKDFVFSIRRPLPFSETKGVTGGVSVQDIDPKTMRSNKIKNLYFAGEVLDLLGPWGGYNIEMAFSTGHLAGLSAAKGNGQEKSK